MKLLGKHSNLSGMLLASVPGFWHWHSSFNLALDHQDGRLPEEKLYLLAIQRNFGVTHILSAHHAVTFKSQFAYS